MDFCSIVFGIASRSPLKFLFGVLLLTLIPLTTPLASNKVATLENNQQLSMTPYIRYTVDETGQLKLADILALPLKDFYTYEGRTPENFGRSESFFWLRVEIQNPYDKRLHAIIELSNPVVDIATFYFPTPTGFQRIDRGVSSNLYERSLDSSFFASRIKFAPKESKVIYVRSQSRLVSTFPINLYTGETYGKQILQRQLISGIFLGVVSGLLIFNLALFLQTRMAVYLSFNFVAICTFFVLFTRNNYFFAIFPDNPDLIKNLSNAVQMTWAVSLATFCIYYLETRKYFPRLHKITLFYIGYTLLFTYLLIINIDPKIFEIFYVLPSMLFGIILIYSGVSRLQAGFTPAIYFLLGIGIPLITGAMKVSVFTGLLNQSSGLELLIANMDSVQLLIISIGMAAIVKILSAKRIESETNAVVAAAKDDTKSKFVNKMSFQIRSPMNDVVGGTELLKASKLSKEQRHYVDVIANSCRSLLSLVDDIISFLREGDRGIELNPEPSRLSKLILETTSVLELEAKNKDLSLTIQIQDHIPDEAWIDANKLRQVLLNLLSNALKFTEKGEITVRLLYLGEHNNRHEFKFEVQDTGIGISEEDQEKLFGSYIQASASTERQFGGTGLGLNISKQIVEAMGGEIGVTSERHQGSTFWFTAHFERIDDKDSHLSSSQEINAIIDFSLIKGQVLIVEDNPLSQQVFQALLAKLSLDSVIAKNGSEAVEIYKADAKKFCAILMDCQLPKLNGYEATRLIRHFEQKKQFKPPVPIIAVTGRVRDGERQACIEAGMSDYLSKPITLEGLSNELSHVLTQQDNKAGRR